MKILEPLRAVFKPGKIGMGADWGRGRVTRVDKGGQADKNGVVLGMTILKVDGKNYHESLLDKRIAGKSDFELVLSQAPPPAPPPPPVKKEDEIPPKPDFKYVTELNPTTFKEMVYGVANGTDTDKKQPPYYPLVMFHVSWCKHCRHALPEFENAAKMVAEQQKSGQHRMAVFPKFFVFECDTPAEHKPVCDMYVGGNYPVIKTFRDRRSVHFNRPRMAQTFAWWAMHVSRPPIVEFPDAHLDGEAFDSPQSPLFVLHADPSKDVELFSHWRDVALDNIEEHSFAFVRPGSKAAKKLPPTPSVTVRGQGLEPVPLDGPINRDSLSDWVNFNQFLPVAELSPYTFSALKSSGYVVVTLMYKGEDSPALKQFEFKAKQFRQNRQFLFASVNVAKEDDADFIEHTFPILSTKFSTPPLIFAFQDDGYWESPSMKDPAALSMESIGALLADADAFQDKSTASWIKEKRKISWRFASGSSVGMMVSVFIVLALLGLTKFCCIPAVKGIFSSDDEPDKRD